ncbi:uncharacterized protein LOC126705692 isoform X4 [Quercus robur]|uniref:uncharacterized protein LOC126705692 isoform X4 n=1 Tax=Quercus robur TaxID=38942 RepID=UPI002163C165|nr:uncharacterized protein LOC126705692 isoform X4 [Quercus robur]
MQSEPLPVERQILGSNASLIKSGTTSYSFHSIGTITDFLFTVQGTLKGSKREKSKKKKLQTQKALTKYLQPTIQMLSGNTSSGKSNLQLY